MYRKDIYQNGEKRGVQRKKAYRIVIFILFFAVAAVILLHISDGSAGHPTADGDGQGVSTSAGAGKESLQSSETDAEWNLTLVNKWNPLPENYAVNLVKIDGGEEVDQRIYQPLMKMLEAARESNLGQLPKVVSGYRTQDKQQELYDEKIQEYRKQGYSEEESAEQAAQWVAVPGHSEHQLGFAVDINGEIYDIYLWLQENSWKYGFIFRYPADKTDITGTAEEVWHYRYVGKNAAAEMHEKGLCLEEYLGEIEREN